MIALNENEQELKNYFQIGYAKIKWSIKMKIVVADTGVIISLVHIQRIDLIEKIFGEYYIAKAVWIELNN